MGKKRDNWVEACARAGFEEPRLIGQGGMAQIWRARCEPARGRPRRVALKRLAPSLRGERLYQEMFLWEARILSRLRNPRIVRLHRVAQIGSESVLVMEYLDGVSASRLLKATGPLDPWTAAFLVEQAALALDAVHRLRDSGGRSLGVVHRDVSPHNLFVTRLGRIKLLDFGVAYVDGVETPLVGRGGWLKGKLAYMAPEMFMETGFDARADIFGLGAVLHELITGTRLFARASKGETAAAVCLAAIPDVREIRPTCPNVLARLTARCLERDRSRRFASGRAVADAIHEARLAARELDEALRDHLRADVVEARRGGIPPASGERAVPGSDTITTLVTDRLRVDPVSGGTR